jgi:hypothetical protein
VGDYLVAASSAGVVGQSAYAGVQNLVTWMREKVGWHTAEPLPPGLTLSPADLAALGALFAAAQVEWMPGPVTSVTATQTVRAGRDITGPVINDARTVQQQK